MTHELGEAYVAYFLPFPPKGHQLDQLGAYFGDPSIIVNTEPWPECSERVHGLHKGKLVCLCVNEDSEFTGQQVTSDQCSACPVICGRPQS